MARSSGLVDDVFEDGIKQQHSGKTGRKKGKNRKPRKQTAAYKIPINTFTQLADAIKDTRTSKVPRYIMTILGDVIKARKGCAAWYRAHQTEESDTSKPHNEEHWHIIEVLEEVHHTLLPLQERLKPTEKKTATETPQPANLFDLLEVEDCPDWDPEESEYGFRQGHSSVTIP
ncbi:hypothetical protein CC86DRAFT_388406 [Ophiobolus disseminans]|uniref:DUF6604 domain-containing protein n=1 Tax=Ophiobolus disseminans TaxID=1469910 RepID=A0A6A6ZFB2_9PLEO|nr:hypothetical protein CC86DRAFT_388406 [Ophiobolus disseminans]